MHKPWDDEAVLEQKVLDNYREPITSAKNIVIKAGSEVLLNKEGKLDIGVMDNLVQQMAYYIKKGYRITYVTSGAVTAGKACVGEEKAKNMTSRGLAKIGQSKLMEIYNFLSRNYLGIEAGQTLIEQNHFSSKRRGKTKTGFDETYKIGILDIVNANDPVWTVELEGLEKGSDNDKSTVWVYNLLDADLAIYLSTVDGLVYNIGEEDERKIDLVVGITTNTRNFVKQINSRAGSWGMASKLKAVDQIMDKGGQAVIANGKQKDVIHAILNGKNIGTYFVKEHIVRPYFLNNI